jgi:hypothetical protein
MARPRRTSLVLLGGALSASSLAVSVAFVALSAGVGCAVGENGDITVDFGPTEPNGPAADAAYEPRPAQSQSASIDGGSSSGSSGGTKSPAPSGAATGGATPPVTPAPAAPKPTPGEVLITEVMFDPSTPEPLGEWIEVHNTASSARSLSGLSLYDGAGRAHVIAAGVQIAGGAYKLLVRNQAGAIAAKVPAAAILYDYGAGLDDASGVLLTNGTTGAVRLRDGATEIAQAVYGGWFATPTGKSVQLGTTTYAASQAKAGWCLSSVAWATGADKGTPGAAEDCP